MSNQVTTDTATGPGDFVDLMVPLLGGSLLGCCFHFPAIAWMAPFGLGALAYSAYVPSRSLASLSAFAGLIAFHLVGLQFLHQTGHLELGLWWPPLALALAVVSMCFLPVTRLLTGQMGFGLTWTFPIAWVATEQLKYWASIPLLDIPFPFLRVGPTLHQQSDLLQCADLVGGSGLSWMVAIFATLVADCLRTLRHNTGKRRRLLNRLLIVGGILLVAMCYGYVRSGSVTTQPGPTIGLIPDLFPSDAVDGDLQMEKECDRLEAKMTVFGMENIDLLVWSEMSLVRELSADKGSPPYSQRWDRLHHISHRLNCSAVIGAPRSSSNKAHHNSCFYISKNGKDSGFYDKHFLGPGDEFQPTVGRVLSIMTGRLHLAPESLNWSTHTPGSGTPVFLMPAEHKGRQWILGTSICFDIWFSGLFRQYLSQPQTATPDFFVNIADEVFTGDREFSYAHWALVEARLRAIEARRTMVRNCGDGFSAVISPTGELLAVEAGASNTKRLIVYQIPISRDVTAFSLLGDWVAISSFAISVWVLLVALATQRKSRSSFSNLPGEIPVGYEDLSIIVPAFNEAGTIQSLLQRVRRVAPNAEIIVVNDASTDGTGNLLNQIAIDLQLQSLCHEVNRGKGAAIRTGLTQASRRFTIIQDSDEEYCPEDYEQLVRPMRSHEAAVVYGSRYLPTAEWRRPRWRIQDLAITGLNWMVLLLYGERLTDEATCYKVFDTQLLKSLDLKCEGFEFCPEVTAKVLRLGHSITEVPIRYSPRSYAEGKKIRWTHALSAAWTLVKWRFFPFRQTPSTVAVAPPTMASEVVSR